MINHLCKNILVSRREIYISALYSVSFQNASKQTIKERKMEENQAALEMDLATRMKMGEFIKSPTMCSTVQLLYFLHLVITYHTEHWFSSYVLLYIYRKVKIFNSFITSFGCFLISNMLKSVGNITVECRKIPTVGNMMPHPKMFNPTSFIRQARQAWF